MRANPHNVRQIKAALLTLVAKARPQRRSQFEVEVRRMSPGSVKIRVTDPGFQGMSRVRRDRQVEALLADLPEDAQADIQVLVCVTPEERQRGNSFASIA